MRDQILQLIGDNMALFFVAINLPGLLYFYPKMRSHMRDEYGPYGFHVFMYGDECFDRDGVRLKRCFFVYILSCWALVYWLAVM